MSDKYEMCVEDGKKEKVPFWLSTRLGLAAIGFIGFLHIYAQRVGMSVAIVCMVNQTAIGKYSGLENGHTNGNYNNLTLSNSPSEDNSTFSPLHEPAESQCAAAVKSGDKVLEDGPFAYTKAQQGHILGAFFYGYLVSQVPAGMLAELYSGKWIMFGFITVCTIATILTPLAAQMHFGALIAIRVIGGIGSGACYPAMHAIWGKWAPPNERSKLSNLTYAGAWLGNVVALPLSGLLCQFGFGQGWDSIFYIIGGSSCLWLVLWAVFVADSPNDSKTISPIEKEYILNSLKGQMAESAEERRKEKTPWLEIVKSGPMWGILAAACACDWGLYFYLTNIPTYMSEVLKFDIQSNGFFSALPFLGLYLNMNISPFLADKLLDSGWDRTRVRKGFQAVGSIGAAIFLIGLAFVDCTQPMLAVGLLVGGVTISSSVYSGYLTNAMDIAPKYAGTLLGIANGLASFTGFAVPAVTAALTPDGTAGQWRYVFFLSSGIYLFGCVAFCLLASGEVQPWAAQKSSESDKSKPAELQKLHSAEENVC